MTKAMRIRYDITMFDYDPSPKLNVDPSAIPSDQFNDWRRGLNRTQEEMAQVDPNARGTQIYPSVQNIADRFGLTKAIVNNWSTYGIPEGPSAAWFRLGVIDEVELFYDECPAELCKAIAVMCNSYEELAEEIGSTHDAVKRWGWDGAKIRGFAGPLLLTLAKDMSVKPWTGPFPHPNRHLTASQAREAKRLHQKEGMTYMAIARKFGVNDRIIGMICRGRNYKWI